MFAQHQDTRRRIDGSIDIDFYRNKGLMERRVVMTDFFMGMGRMKKGLVAAAILAAALYIMPSSDGAGWNGPAAAGPGLNSASLTNTGSATR